MSISPSCKLLRKQELNLRQQEGSNFYHFVFHICVALPRHWTLKNSWANILKAWHFQWGLNTWNFSWKWKVLCLHQRATLSLLAVKWEICSLAEGNIVFSSLLSRCPPFLLILYQYWSTLSCRFNLDAVRWSMPLGSSWEPHCSGPFSWKQSPNASLNI